MKRVALMIFCLFALISVVQAQSGNTGFIQIKGEPGLQVLLDGTLKGATSAAEEGMIIQGLVPGTHQLRVAKPGFRPQETRAVVRANEVFVYEVRSFTPQIRVEQEGEIEHQEIRAEAGSLLIRTVPVEAVIEIPSIGIDAGSGGSKTRMDWRIPELPSGNHPALVRALGREVRFTIEVLTDQRSEYLINVLADEVTDLREAARQEEIENRRLERQRLEVERRRAQEAKEARLAFESGFDKELRSRRAETIRTCGTCSDPYPKRQRDYLERFALEGLIATGTLNLDGELWGLVLDPEGVLHRVRPGTYLGKNFGLIHAIGSQRVQVFELVQGADGQWLERQVQININDTGDAR